MVVHGTGFSSFRFVLISLSFFYTVYGASTNDNYMSIDTPGTQYQSSTTTITFAPVASPQNQFGFTLGDIDAEDVTITAIGENGVALTAAELGFQGVFNYANQAFLPTWDAATSTLKGDPLNTATAGASGWFRPTVPIISLSLTGKKISSGGTPNFQLWTAGFAC